MKNQKGFALILVSIGVVAISLAVTYSLGFYTAQIPFNRNQATLSKMNTIDKALTDFVALNGRFPCPASPTDNPSSTAFGKESRDASYICNASGIVAPTTATKHYMGTVPVRSLGLSNDYMIDGWGNKIEYVISPGISVALNESATNNYGNDGSLVVQDDNAAIVESNAAYLLISRGANGYGAYNAASSNRNAFPPLANSMERDNLECSTSINSCDTSYFDTVFKLSSYSASDDIITYKNKTAFENNCYLYANSYNCLSNQCVNSANNAYWKDAVRSIYNSEEVINISDKNSLPYLDLTAIAQRMQTGSYSLTFKISDLSTINANIVLYYDYTTMDDPGTTVTVQLATFASSGTPTYGPSDIGTYTAPLLFGTPTYSNIGPGHLPKRLYFKINPSSTPYNALLKITNPIITNTDANQNGISVHQFWKLDSSTFYPSSVMNVLYKHASFPNSPYYNTTLNNSYANQDLADFYGRKISGYITPTTTGSYRFYISCDSYCEFYLSAIPGVAHRSRVSYNLTFPNYPRSQWTTYGTQTSTTFNLTANQSYYFEAIQVEDWGGDFVEFAWQLNSGPINVIGSSNLSSAPKDIIISPPTCSNGFTQVNASLTPPQASQVADIISLNNARGRYVKLSLLSSQPTSAGQDPRQDVYFLGEVKFRTPSNTMINPSSIYKVSSEYYLNNNMVPWPATGLTDCGSSCMTNPTTVTATAKGDFITNQTNFGEGWVTQNTSAPQYVIFDLGTTYQLKDIFIWNGIQLFTSGSVTCCPGRSVKDVKISVSDDINHLLYQVD